MTVVIKPGWEWEGHKPGQYLRVGFQIDGKHHWRAYSITSDPGRPDGFISITPKLLETGAVTPYVVREAKPGTIVRLGGVEGTFVLPDEVPERLLFVSAGSGITPIMSMLRSLERDGELRDVVHLHCPRGGRHHLRRSAAAARRAPRRLPAREAPHARAGPARARRPGCAVPRLAPARGVRLRPAGLLDALMSHWERAGGDPGRLHMERFQPIVGQGDGEHGAGGPIRFLRSRVRAESDGEKPILVAGEEAGASLPFGCRMGICHTCVGRLCSGRLRDLRSGEVHGSEGEMVRTCVNAPEGTVEIAL